MWNHVPYTQKKKKTGGLGDQGGAAKWEKKIAPNGEIQKGKRKN